MCFMDAPADAIGFMPYAPTVYTPDAYTTRPSTTRRRNDGAGRGVAAAGTGGPAVRAGEATLSPVSRRMPRSRKIASARATAAASPRSSMGVTGAVDVAATTRAFVAG